MSVQMKSARGLLFIFHLLGSLPLFLSKTNTMNVSLYSDNMHNDKGFLAQYEADGSVSNNSEGEGIGCFIEL